MTKKGTVAAAK